MKTLNDQVVDGHLANPLTMNKDNYGQLILTVYF